MQNNTKFEAISLDNLNTVTGGYHDPAEPAPAPAPDGGRRQEPVKPEKKESLGERLRKLIPIIGPMIRV